MRVRVKTVQLGCRYGRPPCRAHLHKEASLLAAHFNDEVDFEPGGAGALPSRGLRLLVLRAVIASYRLPRQRKHSSDTATTRSSASSTLGVTGE
jgi:hypothetical protein